MNYNMRQCIECGKNTTERDLYELFGDQIEVRNNKGKLIKDYWNKYKNQ